MSGKYIAWAQFLHLDIMKWRTKRNYYNAKSRGPFLLVSKVTLRKIIWFSKATILGH